MKLRAKLALGLALVALPLTIGLVVLRDTWQQNVARAALVSTVRARMEGGGREACEANPEAFREPLPPPERPRPPFAGDPGGPLDPLVLLDRMDARGGPDRPPRGNRPPPGPGRGLDGPRPLGGPPRPGPRPQGARLELFAYYPDFHSANPSAPAIPAALRAELERGGEQAASDIGADAAAAPHAPEVVVTASGQQVLLRMSWSDGPCAIVFARLYDPADMPRSKLERYGLPFLLVAGVFGASLLAIGPFVRRVRGLTLGVRRSAASGYVDLVPADGSDELSELGRAFNVAGETVRAQISGLERRDKSLRKFVEDTTHDVMLPLTVIQGHLAALRKNAERGEVPDARHLDEALEEAQYLGSIVQNLGAASKLEAVEMPLAHHRFPLGALVERVAARHAMIARSKGVELVHALPGDEPESKVLEAEGDVTLVEQALSNVVHNAVRYNREGGHVAIVLEKKAETFVVRVIDDGPGVADEELERLAQRSWRSEEARRRHPTGTGLGLSIAKDVCERHKFTFALRRRDPNGLEVEISGPLAASSGE